MSALPKLNAPAVFDRRQLRKNHERCAKNFSRYDFLIKWTQEQLLERLNDIRRDFPLAVQTGRLEIPAQSFRPGQIETLIYAPSCPCTPPAELVIDEEFLPYKRASLDLVLNTLNLHNVNDLPGALIQINHALKPDGLFLAALFGGETLYELRESLMQAELETRGGVSPRIFPFADKQQMGALLQRAGFALPVVDSEILSVTYEDIFKLMHDLRFMGEGNIILERSKTNPGKAFFARAAEYYRAKFSEGTNRIRASFEIIFLIGWAPHENQPKPLRPGSAQNRLADALKTKETTLHD